MEKDQELRASRLREARIAMGYKDATEAAERFGWNVISYRSHENGIRGIKPTVGKRYAKAYKISHSWLMTGEGGMTGPGIDAEIMELPPALSAEVLSDVRKLLDAAKVRGRISKG
jgi:hypothetical protein